MEQEGLLQAEDIRPLSDRMRPESLEEYVGQKQLVAKGNLLWRMIENDKVTSMIFWGPPGVGKTTLESTAKKMLPLFAAMILGLLLVTYIPFVAKIPLFGY